MTAGAAGNLIGAAVGTFLVPLALTSLGVSATMYAGAAITFAGLLACLAWAEETRHRSLEESGGEARAPAGAETAGAGRR